MSEGVAVSRVDTVDGYCVWSETYDEPGNGIFDIEEPIVREILDTLPVGLALDAACGTGRYAEYLVAQGHRVLGVDSSPNMLARARRRVPRAEFVLGALHRLPLPDDGLDVVICALALTHVPDLRPAMTEFARVLRPGGHLVISDVHNAMVLLGSVPKILGPGGEPGLLPAYRHLASDYLAAALPLGLQLRRCEEPCLPDEDERRSSAETEPRPPAAEMAARPWEDWPWSLLDMVPQAASAAFTGTPALIIWHLQLAESGSARR